MPSPPPNDGSDVLAHDLLRLASFGGLEGDAAYPDWAGEALRAAPWVVVRRAHWKDGKIPVGVRGPKRHQRWAGWLKPDAVVERLAPEAVLARLADLPSERLSALPALAALEPLAALLRGYAWGPTGSVGFELASGRPTVKPSSDLDVVIRCERPLLRTAAASLAEALGAHGVRCDPMMETPAGGVALLEYARVGGAVAARGPDGPRLVIDPWTLPEAGEGGV